MRSVAMLAIVLTVPLHTSGPGSAMAAPAESGAYRVVLPRRVLGAGESVELKLVPPAPVGARITGVSPDGIYRAPYVIHPGAPPVQVSLGFSHAGVRVSATTEIELIPGSVPGAEDCLGPGQSFSTRVAGIEPDYLPVDELPELIQRVEPEYPRSAFVRGIEDTIPIRALVCRSGRVLDAYLVPSFVDRGDTQPIERDPKLVEAAIAAVRQYVFKPGLVSGQAVALWVGTPVAFRR